MILKLEISRAETADSFPIELRYAGASPTSVVQIREPGSRIVVQFEPVGEIPLLCYDLGVNYGEWTTAHVRLQGENA